jgi:hypothetical protein
MRRTPTMPSIISLEKGQTTCFNMPSLAFWRLLVGVSMAGNVPCFSLMIRYPPGSPQEQIALAKVTCPVTEDHSALQRVADVALLGGTLDRDQERTREAFTLFKNNDRVKGDVLEQCIEDSFLILKAYWSIRNWVIEGCKEDQEIEVSDHTKLLLRV